MATDPNDLIWAVMERLEATGRAPFQRRLADYMAPGGDLSGIEVHPRYRGTAERLADDLPRLPAALRASWPSVAAPGARLALSSEREPFTGVAHLMALDPGGEAVAALVGGDVYVSPAWRGRGLGAELLLARAVLHDRGRRDGLLYSPEGHAAAVASHRLAVSMALARGREVDPLVLADHPGRLPGAAPGSAVPPPAL